MLVYKSLFLSILIGISTCIEDKNDSIKNHPSWKYIDNEEESCGESYNDRIVGGTDASLGQYPWLALLGLYFRKKIILGCGGALINPIYVLTAAHCFEGPFMPTLVRLGEHNLKTDIDCVNDLCAEPAQDINIAKVIVYGELNKMLHDDIALIRLEHKVSYNGWVSPICLPRSTEMVPEVGSVLETAGWGAIDMKATLSANVLQKINLPVISKKDCQAILIRKVQIIEKQLCAGGISNKDTCRGDSGGPIMKVDDSNGYPQYYLIGIVSFGPVFCGNKVPGVYTSVPHYLNWILDHIEPTE